MEAAERPPSSTRRRRVRRVHRMRAPADMEETMNDLPEWVEFEQ
jgi:hypothetical protein